MLSGFSLIFVVVIDVKCLSPSFASIGESLQEHISNKRLKIYGSRIVVATCTISANHSAHSLWFSFVHSSFNVYYYSECLLLLFRYTITKFIHFIPYSSGDLIFIDWLRRIWMVKSMVYVSMVRASVVDFAHNFRCSFEVLRFGASSSCVAVAHHQREKN